MEAFFNYGGAKGDRTPGLLNAIQALSQLSYSPVDILLVGPDPHFCLTTYRVCCNSAFPYYRIVQNLNRYPHTASRFERGDILRLGFLSQVLLGGR